jgi:hypothetical protein
MSQSKGGRMTDDTKKYTTDEQTGKQFEIVPEKRWDTVWACVSFTYLSLALGFFLWLLLDTWLRKNTVFVRWLHYSSIEPQLGLPIFRSFAYAFIGGALGGVIAGYRSCIFWHSEQQAFGARFVWRYAFFPWLGGTLALFVYAILGSGIGAVGGNVSAGATNMLSALALGSLVGYGSPQVVKWLDSQVNKLFKVTPATDGAIVPAPKKTVPDLAGLTQQDAETKLTDAGLKFGTVYKRSGTGGQAGMILAQDPAAGSQAAAGAAVNVTIAQ